MISNSRSLSWGESGAVGSSKMTTWLPSAKFQNLDELAQGHTEIPERFVETQAQFLAHFGEQCLRPGVQPAPIQPARHPQTREHDVLKHREVGGERRLLRYDCDATAHGITRVHMPHRDAVQQDLALIGLDALRYDPRPGRLASPVGAHERVDFPASRANVASDSATVPPKRFEIARRLSSAMRADPAYLLAERCLSDRRFQLLHVGFVHYQD
jgi:hypothetical protein